MRYKCESKDLFGNDCMYGGEVDTSKDAYSIRKVESVEKYYHFVCSIENPTEMIALKENSLRDLKSFVRQAFYEDIINGKEVPNFVWELLKND